MPQARAYVLPRRFRRHRVPPSPLGGAARAAVRVYRAVTSRACHVPAELCHRPLTPRTELQRVPQARAYVPPRRVPRRQAPPQGLWGPRPSRGSGVSGGYLPRSPRSAAGLVAAADTLLRRYGGAPDAPPRPPRRVPLPPHQPCYRLSPLPRPGGLLHACICAPYHLHLLLTQTSPLHPPSPAGGGQERTRHSDFTATFWVGSNRPADTQAATCYMRVDRAVAGW